MSTRKYPSWLNLILAVMLVLGLGIAQAQAAPNIIIQKNRYSQNPARRPPSSRLPKPFSRPLWPPWRLLRTVDETKVPHYFGPFPNWALSSLTLPDVAVQIIG